MKYTFKNALYCCLIIAAIVLQNCKRDSDYEPGRLTKELAKKEFYNIMKEYYLWNYNLPLVNLHEYTAPEDLLEVLRNDDPYDKWSFVISAADFIQFFEQGEIVDHGFDMKLDENNEVRVAYIYDEAPLYKEGVRRGWKVAKINGKDPKTYSTYYEMFGTDEPGVSNTIEFESLLGQPVTITTTKTIFKANTVLHKEVFNVAGKKAGYMVFMGFLQTSKQELEEAFSYFKTEGIEELVLDLRYNPGGDMSVTVQLASLITGVKTDGQVLVNYEHNPDYTSENFTEKFALQPNSLNLNRLFVIATKSSASASEVVINGLKPYISVIVIGDDTHGKPVGMYSFLNKEYDYAYVPICFELRNKNGEGDYFEGLKADAYVYDNVTEPWGSLEEDCLKEALYYIENGSFSSAKSLKSARYPASKLLNTGGLKSLSMAFQKH